MTESNEPLALFLRIVSEGSAEQLCDFLYATARLGSLDAELRHRLMRTLALRLAVKVQEKGFVPGE